MKEWNGRRTAAVCLLFLVLWSITACQEKPYHLDPQAKDGGYIMGEAVAGRQKEKKEFRIQINSRPETSDSGRVPFMIGNPEENESEIRVRIELADTGEQIFQSEILKPGERQAYGTLKKELEPGEYEAMAVFMILDSKSGEETGSVETGITICIL